MKLKFYLCSHCKNLIVMINDSGVNPVCCGDKMREISANTTDAALEKHVPVYERKDNAVFVKVGSTAHPMEEKHYIEWIVLLKDGGFELKRLKPGDKSEAVFYLADGEKVLAVYAYCNLHSLWMKEIE